MKILVFGREGQLARAFRSRLPEAVFVGREACDFGHPQSIVPVLNAHRPHIVINPAAFTEVDRAETDRELSLLVNATAPRIIAEWCAENAARMVHYSTDYVYPGTGVRPWREDGEIRPVNFYGETKWRGEQAVRDVGGAHLIFRTSWVFSPWGKNFVRTMLRLAETKTELGVVADQIGQPTYAPDLADATLAVLAHRDLTPGVSETFNVCNAGETSWFGFAKEIFRLAEVYQKKLAVRSLKPLTSAEYPTPATRPLNSRLDTAKLNVRFGVKLRPWTEALEEAVRHLTLQDPSKS